MTFTYTPSSVNDTTRVRFHIGDTVEASAIFSDEEITMMISEEGTWQKAAIACVDGIIAQLSSDPDFKADWLTVSPSKAIPGYERLRTRLQRKFGISSRITATSKPVYRSDSLQDEAPDW